MKIEQQSQIDCIGDCKKCEWVKCPLEEEELTDDEIEQQMELDVEARLNNPNLPYSTRFYLKNPDKCREYGRTYYNRHKEEMREKNRKYYQEHKEYFKQKDIERKRNKPVSKEKQHQYYLAWKRHKAEREVSNG